MATNLPSCFSIQFLEQLLKFLVNFTLLKYVKSQRSYGFLITKELIFGFQILDLKDHSSASLSEAPAWTKMLLEQISSVNEKVLDMTKELQLFKIKMYQRVGQVESDVKLQQFQCQTMSLEVTSLRKELAEIKPIDDLEQYSRRNCLILTGIKEAGEDETENADKVILDICRNKLQIELHRFILDRTHGLGRKRIPRPDSEVPKPRPIVAKLIKYQDRDSVYKCKRKLKESELTTMKNLTKRRVDLFNEAREAVAMKNTWTFDGRIYAIYKGKRHNIKSKEDLEKILSG